MKKKIIYCTFLLLFVALYSTLVYAENNSMMKNAADSVKNTVAGAENVIEDTARGITNTSKDITGKMQNAGNTVTNNVGNSLSNIGNSVTNNTQNIENTSDNNTASNTGFMGLTDDNTDGYTATRTSTADDATVMGINSTTWIWIIMALSAVGIGILIYSYFSQTNSTHNSNLDD